MSDSYDITAKVGPLFPLPGKPEIPMYSYERPAYMLWNAIGKALTEAGWNEAEVAEWLRSKYPRWDLDGSLGDAIEELGRAHADTIVAREDLIRVREWVAERKSNKVFSYPMGT